MGETHRSEAEAFGGLHPPYERGATRHDPAPDPPSLLASDQHQHPPAPLVPVHLADPLRVADRADAAELRPGRPGIGAAEPDGDLRRQDDPARDVHPRAAERPDRPGAVAVDRGGDRRLAELRRREPPGSPALAEAANKARQAVAGFAETYGYKNALLFDPDGNTLLRFVADLDPGANLLSGPLRDSELAEVFDRTRTLLQVDLSDYQVYPGRSEPAAFIAGPVYDPRGRIGGYLALELGNGEVFQAFANYNGLGETGEAVVASRDGDQMWFVAPTRRSGGDAGEPAGPDGAGTALSMERAVQGRRGYGETTDYRGASVMAVWSYLPSYRWGLVVKQDVDEAFALTRRQILIVAVLLVVTAVIVTVVALVVARTLARPIREAALVAERIAAGDLTATTDAEAPGEAGLLLRAIRKMIEDLRSLIARIQRSSISLLSTATEIAATSRQQEQAVYDYSASTNEAAAAVNEISATSQELLKTMNEVNQVANQAARMASTGQTALSGMDQTMRQLAEFDRLDRLEALGHQRARRQHQPGRHHHHQGRRPDQPAVDQRGHRGREGRRVRPGLPGRRPRDPPPGRPDRRRHAGHRAHGQGDAVQRLGRRHGDGQVQRTGAARWSARSASSAASSGRSSAASRPCTSASTR